MLVSLCTVCKNRAHHYKKTILKNIHDNIHDSNVEFILLDYNSQDDLEEWVKDNLQDYIEMGVVTYYKTFDPLYFQRSHSRNMVFRLAKGDLICNIDADNYTGYSFSTYLAKQFARDINFFVCAGGQNDSIPQSDIGGRICIHHDNFVKVGGYDEWMRNYGFEDYDLINRLEIANINKKLIKDQDFLKVIEHEAKDRITEEFPYKNIKDVMISYISPSSSTILLIFLDDTCVMGTLINERTRNSSDRSIRFEPLGSPIITLVNDDWDKGKINYAPNEEINLVLENNLDVYKLHNCPDEAFFSLEANNDKLFFYKLSDDNLIVQALLFYSETHNRSRMQKNLIQKIVNPNQSPIGCGTVYKNFDYNTPIILK